MALSEKEELELLELENENALAMGGMASSVVTPQTGFLKRADTAAGNVINTGLDVVAAPFEVVGEALRLPMEGKPLSDFRAPTIVQKLTGVDYKSPADPFSQINKGIRAASGFIENIPTGGISDVAKAISVGHMKPESIRSAKEGAKEAYNADRGDMGTVEDMALALTTGRISPKIVNAPADALVEGARAALRAGKKIAAPIRNAASNTGKALISATLGPSVKDINMRIARNPEIINAKPFEILAQEFPDEVMKVSNRVGEMQSKALDTLSPSRYLMEGAAAKDSIINAVRLEKDGLGRTVSDANAHAKKVLDRYAYRLRRLGNTVSEQELGKIIRDIDNDIDWSSKEMTPLNNALEGVRTRIDGMLKGQNKNYETAMMPVAEGTRLLKKLQTIFQVENDIGKGFKAKNSTASALKSAIDEKRIDSREALKGLEGITGRSMLREIENAGVAEAFVGGRANGSRRVNLGAALGAAVGAPIGGWGGASIGSLTGALTGAYIDTQGGKLAGNVIDNLVRLSRNMEGVGIGKPISTALQKVINASGVLTSARPEDKTSVQGILDIVGPESSIASASNEIPVNMTRDMIAYRNGLNAYLSGDNEKAIKEWEKAVKINPLNLDADRGLERLKRKKIDAEMSSIRK